MQLPPEIRPRPYTHAAFEGACLAQEAGLREAWSDRVYRAYWEQGRDIGQVDVLCDLAEEIGLHREQMRQVLENGIYAEKVDAQLQHTLDTYHPRGVPILFADGQRIRLRAYTLEGMEEVLSGFLPEDDGGETGCSGGVCRLL